MRVTHNLIFAMAIGLAAGTGHARINAAPDIPSVAGLRAGPRTVCEGPGARYIPLSRHLVLDRGQYFFRGGEIRGAYPGRVVMSQGNKTFTLRPLTNPPNGLNYVLDSEEGGQQFHPVPVLCIRAERD